ncbi:bZIP transcription factor TGA10-like isoform X2 [Diospyros lotus]|uniref:bZIP transcription factor TGA10-like isoform X2 n=1 Tax=Diospyros lotus TaxID=55363 RepID=UPI0022537F8D|nr:bZIP transcription factor TGA10-like isoform X2 [Diospyros lotus]
MEETAAVSVPVMGSVRQVVNVEAVEEERKPLLGFLASSKGDDPLQQYHHQHQHQLLLQQHMQQSQLGLVQNHGVSSSSSSAIAAANFMSKDTAAYDLSDLDQALFLYFSGQDVSSVQDQKPSYAMSPPTLNIFPSQPMHTEPSPTKATVGLVSPSTNTGSKRCSDQPPADLSDPKNNVAPSPDPPAKTMKPEGTPKGPTSSSEQERPKTPDPKTLRRLAQNREAARKSRLRKKAYVQQLESSRLKLAQLEQELQRARSLHGCYVGVGDHGIPLVNNISPVAGVFDMEYGKWMEQHHRLMWELRAAMEEQIPENELRVLVDNCLAHFDEMMNLKSLLAKADVFHLVSGSWKSPAERCFMWLGGFRPSNLLKIVVNQMGELTQQQLLGVYGLQQSAQEGEEALSQGMEALYQALSDTISSDALNNPTNVADYMNQMALAIDKLSTIEAFVQQADNLRQQIVHRLHQILTTRQAAICLLAMAEYFHRLRALSSLWLARPRQP